MSGQDFSIARYWNDEMEGGHHSANSRFTAMTKGQAEALVESFDQSAVDHLTRTSEVDVDEYIRAFLTEQVL